MQLRSPIDMDDAVTFAQSVLNPGKFSPRAAEAIAESQNMYKSP